MRKILVTGGMGFIGNHLVKRLLQDKQNQVYVLDRYYDKVNEKQLKAVYASRVKFYTGNLLMPLQEWHGMQLDQIYHLAAEIGTRDSHTDPWAILNGNIAMMNQISTHAGNARVLFTSTMETVCGLPLPSTTQLTETLPVGFQEPFSPRQAYRLGKYVAEYMLTHSVVEKWSIVRFSNVYGPRTLRDYVIPSFFKRAVAKQNPFVVMHGNDTRCFVYVDDVVDGMIKTMNSDQTLGQTLNIAGNTPVSISVLAHLINRIAGNDCEYKFEQSDDTTETRLADIRKAKHLIDWEPTTTLEVGLQKSFNLL